MSSTEFQAVVAVLDSGSEETAVRKVAGDGRPAVPHREGPLVMWHPAPAPRPRRRDGYLAAVIASVFVMVMTLAAATAVLYAPLPRAQLVVALATSIVTSISAVLTAALAWRRSR